MSKSQWQQQSVCPLLLNNDLKVFVYNTPSVNEGVSSGFEIASVQL